MNLNIAQLEYKLNESFKKEYGTFIGYVDKKRGGWHLIAYFGTQILSAEYSAYVLELYDSRGIVRASFNFLKDYVSERKAFSEALFDDLKIDCYKLDFFKREEVRDIRFYKYRHSFSELTVSQLENLSFNLSRLEWFKDGDEISFELDGTKYGKVTLINRSQMLCLSRRSVAESVAINRQKQYSHLFEELVYCALNMLHVFKIGCELAESTDIGCLVEVFNKAKNCTELAIYLGDKKILYIYNSLVGINQSAFDALANKQLDENRAIADQLGNITFYEKRCINVLTDEIILERLRCNLTKWHGCEQGDIVIAYESSYFQTAIVSDKHRMLCIQVEPVDDVVREESLWSLIKHEHGALAKVQNGNDVFDTAFENMCGKKPELDGSQRLDVIKRAQFRLGRRNFYYLNGGNSQDFVTECRYCYAFNQQVRACSEDIGVLAIGDQFVVGVKIKVI